MSGWGWVTVGYVLTGMAWVGYAWWIARGLKDAS